MKQQYDKRDIEKILQHYDLGKFKKFGKILKNDVVSFGQVIHTSKKKVFMKVFNILGIHIKQSLTVASYVKRKGFPTYQIYLSKKKKHYIIYNKKHIALLEYLELNEKKGWEIFKNSQIIGFARGLARFHNLTHNLKLKRISNGDLNDIERLIKRFHKIRKRRSKKIQKILEFMNANIKNTKCPSKEYKSGYFSEFNPGHVFFSGDKIKYVIDWEIGWDNAYYDLGSSMMACFSKDGKKLYYNKLRTFILEYNKIRTLSKWEIENIYTALLFGIFKYGVWGLVNIKKGGMESEGKINKDDINRVLYILNLTKREFDLKLNLKGGKLK